MGAIALHSCRPKKPGGTVQPFKIDRKKETPITDEGDTHYKAITFYLTPGRAFVRRIQFLSG